jgi:predicted mannosyl-3-phosphoglycerate phosphatase (HAD superfamily)
VALVRRHDASVHPIAVEKEHIMTNFGTRARAAGMTLALGAGALAVAAPAHAQGGGDQGVERQGSCSAGAQWKLKAKHDDGRIETEFEVDSNRVGQRWVVRIADNGVLVFRGARLTHVPSGSFTVERRIANRRGADHIRAVARQPRTGQRCVGTVTL